MFPILTPATGVLVTEVLVLPHLDYCSAVWSGAANKDLSKFQVDQNKAARLKLPCSLRVRQSTERLHASHDSQYIIGGHAI